MLTGGTMPPPSTKPTMAGDDRLIRALGPIGPGHVLGTSGRLTPKPTSREQMAAVMTLKVMRHHARASILSHSYPAW